MPGVDDTAPCVGCGLCCDGTLYSRAKVAADEKPRVTSFGLSVFDLDGQGFFSLPCRHHHCGQCTIYRDRFSICRSFRCALLRSYQAGEITLGAARAKVETAKGLVAKVEGCDPAAVVERSRPSVRSRLSLSLEISTDTVERTSLSRRIVNIIALSEYLDRWFVNKKTGEP